MDNLDKGWTTSRTVDETEKEMTQEEIDAMHQHQLEIEEAQNEMDAMRHGDNLDHQIEIHRLNAGGE